MAGSVPAAAAGAGTSLPASMRLRCVVGSQCINVNTSIIIAQLAMNKQLDSVFSTS